MPSLMLLSSSDSHFKFDTFVTYNFFEKIISQIMIENDISFYEVINSNRASVNSTATAVLLTRTLVIKMKG